MFQLIPVFFHPSSSNTSLSAVDIVASNPPVDVADTDDTGLLVPSLLLVEKIMLSKPTPQDHRRSCRDCSSSDTS